MIIKVCGLREKTNHQDLSKLEIDMIGINFYKPSKRFIGDHHLEMVDQQTRVGVFVRAPIEEIVHAQNRHALDFIQLHGDEDVEYCQQVQTLFPIIKVFRINDSFDWTTLKEYSFADYFLFDTETPKYGGSGLKFDWNILDKYTTEVPFFLSGGIGPDDAFRISQIEHKDLVGIDINSKFESTPAIKDTKLVEKFIKELKNI